MYNCILYTHIYNLRKTSATIFIVLIRVDMCLFNVLCTIYHVQYMYPRVHQSITTSTLARICLCYVYYAKHQYKFNNKNM